MTEADLIVIVEKLSLPSKYNLADLTYIQKAEKLAETTFQLFNKIGRKKCVYREDKILRKKCVNHKNVVNLVTK